jgi:hypothetical protein
MKKYYVYLITNTILNKQYVGSRISTKTDLHEDNYWGSSKYLNEDFKIYGKENFIKEIINDTYKNKIEMLNGETENILKYNTLTPKGYNRYLPNKYPGFHREGCPHTEKSKRLISKRTKEEMKKINLCGKNNSMYKKSVFDIWCQKYGEEIALKLQKERNEKQSRSMIGKNKGKRRTPETLKKLSEAHKNKKHSEETKNKMRGKNNSMYNKTVYEVWIKNYGIVEADKKI